RVTYIFPAVAFSSDIARTCKVKPCAPWTWTTYVPVLDPNTFSWLPGTASSASSAMAPASSAAAVLSSAKATSSSSSAKAASSAASSVKPASPPSSSAPAAPVNPNDGLQILR
ncbi:MAG TPA: hypothetical protein PKV72_05685, partial [Candidatus Peribacteria bacterium]|nr:hypothetical protein [Candidatus Peribacteria bacterium]